MILRVAKGEAEDKTYKNVDLTVMRRVPRVVQLAVKFWF
jgi:hypothetical protein